MYVRRLIFFAVLVFFIVVADAKAATLYLEPNTTEINRGDTLAVVVRLDTDEAIDECVNVVDATIRYSENIEPVDTTRGSSIMSVWLEEPVINKAERTITFAGGIPNGYCGRIPGDPRLTNVILELFFRSPGMVVGAVSDVDTATIDFAPETRVLLNDGFGTDAQLTTYGTNIGLLKAVGNSISNEWTERTVADTAPPEDFEIILIRDPSLFSNRYVIIFNTTDKQSGISHYEVLEEPLEDFHLFGWGAATAPWVTARSPYQLKDQSLNSTIRVRAIDKAGNEYIATLVPDESQRKMTTQSKVMIALVGAVLIGFVVVGMLTLFWYKRRKDTAVTADEDDEQLLDDDTEEYEYDAKR